MYIVYEGVRADEVRVAEYHFCAQPKAKRLRCVSGECAEHRAFVFFLSFTNARHGSFNCEGT